MNTRRTFIKQSGVLTAGLMMKPSELLKKQKTVGLQLYSVRDVIEKDPKGVIEKVAAAGYNEVEMYGLSADNKFYGLTVKELAQLLKDNNLKSPSGHYAPEKLLYDNGNGDDVKNFCEVGHTLGHSHIIIPWLKEEGRKTIDQYKTLAEKINKAGEICKAAGLQLAYHNHDFEFATLTDGITAYEYMLKNTDPKLVKFEMDLYWMEHGGQDPLQWFEKYPGRFPMWHIKDMEASDAGKPKGQTCEVGKGVIDWKKIFEEKKKAGLVYAFVEQEQYRHPVFECIKTSADYIKTNLI